MNVVLLGVSTSQTILAMLAAFSLLVLAALLWKNHRDSVRSPRLLSVLVETGTLCPVDSVARPVPAILVRISGRAPPTFHSSKSPSAFLCRNALRDEPLDGYVLASAD
jgi:hypothetical protein